MSDHEPLFLITGKPANTYDISDDTVQHLPLPHLPRLLSVGEPASGMRPDQTYVKRTASTPANRESCAFVLLYKSFYFNEVEEVDENILMLLKIAENSPNDRVLIKDLINADVNKDEGKNSPRRRKQNRKAIGKSSL